MAQTIQEITLAHGRVSAARARSALSTLYGWAMREGLCEANPVINTSDPARGIKPRERILCQIAAKSDPRFAGRMSPLTEPRPAAAETHIAEQSRSWRAASGEREVIRGS